MQTEIDQQTQLPGKCLIEWENRSIPMSEKSSTRMISFNRWGGDLSMMLCTVRSRTDHASLWKHTTTLVSGKLSLYFRSLHLQWFIKKSLNHMFHNTYLQWFIKKIVNHYIIFYVSYHKHLQWFIKRKSLNHMYWSSYISTMITEKKIIEQYVSSYISTAICY